MGFSKYQFMNAFGTFMAYTIDKEDSIGLASLNGTPIGPGNNATSLTGSRKASSPTLRSPTWMTGSSSAPSHYHYQRFSILSIEQDCKSTRINQYFSLQQPFCIWVSPSTRASSRCSPLRHLRFLMSLIPNATHQDLLRITGYVSWLCYAMG
jgi:hypothetical protein